jgi:hypothetical protein
MRVRTSDGQALSGRTPDEIVRELRKISRTPGDNLMGFMRETADRIWSQHGRSVRHDSTTGFVADLIRQGLLIDEEDV